MKRCFSFLTALCVIFSITVPAFAVERATNGEKVDSTAQASLPLSFTISPIGHGEYSVVSERNSRESGSYEYVEQSIEYTALYRGGNQNYLYVGSDTLFAVDKIDLKSFASADIDALGLPAELTSSIKHDIDTYGQVSGFVLAPTESATKLNLAASNPSYYTHYYGGRNHYMQLYLYSTTNMSTTYQDVARGKNASTTAGALFSMAVTGAGLVVKQISMVDTIVSLFSDLLTALGLPENTTVYGSSEDKVQSKVNWDKIEKYTYVNDSPAGDGNYLIGATTGQVKIRSITTYQYYANSGNAYEHTTYAYPNTYAASPSYSNSDDVAIQYHNTSPKVELPLYGTVGGLDISF